MDNRFVDGAAVECPVDSLDVSGDPQGESVSEQEIPRRDIRRNMVCVIMLDTIWYTGAADLTIALMPLLVFLKASNTMIGAIGSFSAFSLFGMLVTPWITRRFVFKKWYLIGTNIPYVAPIGMIGLAIVFSQRLGATSEWLVMFITAMMLLFYFFGGFVALPHQEYVAACIPMSHRGRYNGFSYSAGAITGMGSSLLGGWILLQYAKPMAFGYLFLLTWFFFQSGYIAAAFARERPTPVEKSPKPWSKAMLKSVVADTRFFRFMILYVVIAFFGPVMSFVTVYGYRELLMIPATAAVIQVITQAIRIPISPLAGIIVDKVGPKRLLGYWPLATVLWVLPAILIHNPWGVYITVAVNTVAVSLMGGVVTVLTYGLPKPEHRAGHFTTQLLISSVVGGVGSIAIGWIFDQIPYRTGFMGFAIIALCIYPLIRWVCSSLSDDIKAYS